jgi:NADP-dependent 3-hydroxy acid dehydrogenase YdfG/SAM-dependent methyltransferase
MDHPYQLAGTRTRLIRDDATYLVTGGLRGFGLATARWLVGLGARHLVLLGRTGAAHEDAKLALAEFRSSGVDVRAIAADVSRLEEVQAAVKCCRAGMPPLKGVFHAAMVLDDVSIAGMSVEALRRVLDAKAVGAWNLHTATVDLHLDLFVLFSSVSRLFAHPGQANYVAANQFLFALADLRHTGGLAATCVDWGVIGDTGVMFRSSDLIERVDRSGIRSMSSAHALAVLESLLLEDAGNVGVFDVDWSVVDAPLGFARSLARYDRVRHLKAQTGEGTSAGLQLEDLRSAAPEQVMDVAREFVRDRVGLVLRRVASEIDEGVALMQLGFDSLMEIELRGLLRTDTGIDLANVRLARDASVERIARILLERLDLSAEVPVPDTQEMGPFLHWISEREAALESAISGEESEFAAEMLSTVEELSVRASQLPMHEHEPRRRIVRAQLGRFFLRSSLLRWAYEKPLGYPGDFELMKRLYVAEPTGDGIDRLIDRFSIERPTGQATRNRAPYLRSLIREVIRSKAPARARIASVGCGPAWEIRTLLAESPELSESIELVLVDQDERALKDCESALGGWRERGLALKLLCCPIEDLVRAQSSALASLGARDLLYSSGLFDYFNDGNFEVYLQALYEHIAPGGALVVGNLSAASPDRWFIEYLADWFLYYRTKEQLLERGQSLLPEPSSVRVEAEPVGINLFLAVQRPGRRSDPPRS